MGAQDEERRAAAVREMWPKGMSKLTRKAKAVRGAAVAVLACVLAAAAFFGVAQNAGGFLPGGTGSAGQAQSAQGSAVDWHSLADLPAYAGEPYVELEGNRPSFTEADRALASHAFEEYEPLDHLGRTTGAFACVGFETMPTQERGDIGSVHPSGWRTSRYAWVDGESLYNRCHLIAHHLSGEDANERNLITGTRCFNTQGMLPFEERMGDYIEATGNHVLLRVTPVYDGDDLVARGVQMEAWSMEDEGAGICFNVFAYNVQPGVVIDYATGENWSDGTMDEGAGSAGEDSSAATGEGAGGGRRRGRRRWRRERVRRHPARLRAQRQHAAHPRSHVPVGGRREKPQSARLGRHRGGSRSPRLPTLRKMQAVIRLSKVRAASGEPAAAHP